jgi:primosomal protein N' (replication factor Y) (superfamily II helicase)
MTEPPAAPDPFIALVAQVPPEGPLGPATPLVARVLPDVAGFERELDYEVPAKFAAEVRPGSIVRVPLQGRAVRGWVVAYPVQPPEGLALRPIAKVTGWGPEPELFELAEWAAWRWASRRRSLLFTASPQAGVRALPQPARSGGPVGTELGETAGAAGGAGTGGPGTGGPVTVQGLVEEAWSPGSHLLRLPPVYSATEVVMAAAAHGPVLVIAPTTARAEAGCAALRSRGAKVAILPAEWAQARAGADVVIGTRAAAWGPCPGAASFVVLDAHDEGLVQGAAPTWDAPSVAAERARLAAVPCLWVTPCPTVELLAAANQVHVASVSAERAGWAALEVVDSRREDPRSGLYSSGLVSVLRSGSRVVCVLNRKGRAQLSACDACGELATCEQCGASVAVVGEAMVCRRCGTSRPIVCTSCGSSLFRLLRVGVSRAREQLEALAGRPVGEVSAGTGPLPATPVLVGTEAVLYREGELRKAGGVGAVAFLDFDQELLASRFRAGEEALALLARASRLVGGRQRAGKVLVQTRAPGHPVIEAALLADPGRLAASEEPVRKALRLPPFAALAVLSGPGARELAGALEKLDGAEAAVHSEVPGEPLEVREVPGEPLELSELADERWVVRAADHASLADALAVAGRPSERVRIEVDPVRF